MIDMNYLGIEKDSIANGTGIRVVLWVSGCSLRCKGCHNPEAWDKNSGKLFDESAKSELFEALSKPYIRGITFSGGHPLERESLPDIYSLIKDIRTNFPEKDIWLYTGYTVSYPRFFSLDMTLNRSVLMNRIIRECDVLVDGEYIEELRDTTLPFRGSSNQRLIDVKRTINEKRMVLLDL